MTRPLMFPMSVALFLLFNVPGHLVLEEEAVAIGAAPEASQKVAASDRRDHRPQLAASKRRSAPDRPRPVVNLGLQPSCGELYYTLGDDVERDSQVWRRLSMYTIRWSL